MDRRERPDDQQGHQQHRRQPGEDPTHPWRNGEPIREKHCQQRTHGHLGQAGVGAHVGPVVPDPTAHEDHPDGAHHDRHEQPPEERSPADPPQPTAERRCQHRCEGNQQVPLFLHRQAPDMAQRRRGAAEHGCVVGSVEHEVPVGHIEQRRPGVPRQRRQLRLGSDQRREHDHRTDEQQHRWQQPPRPAGPEASQGDRARCGVLAEQQRADQEPRQREERRHTQEPAVGHPFEPLHAIGCCCVVEHHGGHREAAESIERRLVLEPGCLVANGHVGHQGCARSAGARNTAVGRPIDTSWSIRSRSSWSTAGSLLATQ